MDASIIQSSYTHTNVHEKNVPMSIDKGERTLSLFVSFFATTSNNVSYQRKMPSHV